MTPAELRVLVPLRAPRTVTLVFWPWLPVLCAVIDCYHTVFFAVRGDLA